MDQTTLRRADGKKGKRAGVKGKLATARREFMRRNEGASESDFVNSEFFRPEFKRYLKTKSKTPLKERNSQEEEYDPEYPSLDRTQAAEFPPPLINLQQGSPQTPRSGIVGRAFSSKDKKAKDQQKKTDEELRKQQLQCHYLALEKHKIQEQLNDSRKRVESLELQLKEMTEKFTDVKTTLKTGQEIFRKQQEELRNQMLRNQVLEEKLRITTGPQTWDAADQSSGEAPEPSAEASVRRSDKNIRKRKKTTRTEVPRKYGRSTDTAAPGKIAEKQIPPGETHHVAEPTINHLLDDSIVPSIEEIRNLFGSEPEAPEETTTEEELAVERVIGIVKPRARIVPRTEATAPPTPPRARVRNIGPEDTDTDEDILILEETIEL